MAGDNAKERIKAWATEAGFADVGFTSAKAPPHWGEDLQAWLADGRHGTMEWMAARADQRADPSTLWPDARSVICLALPYSPKIDPQPLAEQPDIGRISVYAQGGDYHDSLKKKLKQVARQMVEAFGCEVKVFTDTAPVMEKPLAQAAGLGWQGKHTNLVSRRLGNWFFLGEIYTTLELPPDPPETDHCGSCTACIDACPTAAITEQGMDARRCISYLTIEHKGPIADELATQMGNHVYGCDDCLAACPWNKFSVPSDPAFYPRVELTAPKLEELAQLDDAGFRQVFQGSPVKRIGIERLLRNVAIARSRSS